MLKAVEKDPKARYASAEAMSEDLRRFLADEPIQARQVSAAERYWRWARRNPVIATLGGVLTALLVAVTVGSIVAAAYFKESARRETNLAAREQLANQQSQRDRKDAIEARRMAILERDKSRQHSADLALDKGLALARAGPRRPGLALDARGLEDRSGRRGANSGRWFAGTWVRGSGRSTNRSESSTLAAPCDYLAFSPDGKIVRDGLLSRRSSHCNTDRPLGHRLRGESSASLPGAFAPVRLPTGRQGPRLLALTDRRMVAVDLVTGRVLWTTQELPGRVRRNGLNSVRTAQRFLSTAMTGHCSSWLLRLDVVTGPSSAESRFRAGASVAIAPDGRMAATGRIENGEEYIDVLELPSGRRAGILASRAGSGFINYSSAPTRSHCTARFSKGDLFRGHTPLRSDLGRGHRKADQSAHGRDSRRHFTLPRPIVL